MMLDKKFQFIISFNSNCYVLFQTQFLGQSGLVQLDKYGDRTHVEFHIRKLEGEHDYVQGSWNPSNGLLWSKTLPNFIQNGQDENANKDHSIRFEPLIITTVLVRELHN